MDRAAISNAHGTVRSATIGQIVCCGERAISLESVDANQPSERDIELLFAQVRKKIWVYVLQKVPPQEAEDVFQEICLHGFTKMDKLQDREKFLPWIFAIAKRRVLDYYRAKYSHPPTVGEDQFEFSSIEDASFCHDERLDMKELRKCILKLKEPYREVALLHFVVGLTSPEIVKILDINENTIKSHIVRSRPMIHKCMQKKGK